MANKTALYVLLAALALAALTSRWVAASGSRPGFNIVSFDGIYFGLQWIAFGTGRRWPGAARVAVARERRVPRR